MNLKKGILPESLSGKLSVLFTAVFLLLNIVFFTFRAFGLVTFDQGHSWDFTVGISSTAEIIAFISGIIALKKSKERSVLLLISVIIGFCVILFILLHSLFISD